MHVNSRDPLRRWLAGLALLAVIGPAAAQPVAYPARPITLVVPFVAGGTTDIVGRIVAEGLGQRLGQTVVVDNRGGAGGNIGAAVVAQARPDGYTLLMGYNGTNAINPALYPKLSWDPVTSFEPVSMVARVNNVVVVHPGLPVATLPELIAHAKAHPGDLNYGSAGSGSVFHLAGEMLEQQAGVRLVHVPYKGAAPALTDTMGGQVQLMFASIPAALPFIRSGRLKAIAVTGARRSPLFPQLPSASESGYPGMVVDSWFGVFAPKGLPVDVRDRLVSALHAVLSDRATVARLQEQGADPVSSTPRELAELLAADLKRWKQVVATAGVVLD
ncbi:Bug family tripartite tricarboxylate transporter substrate binding protein [Leptothrix sp. BB-4]